MKDSLIWGRVGPVMEAIGGEGIIRLGRSRELIVQQAHGRFNESMLNGALYWVSTQPAGVAPGTAFSTTPPMALWNPTGSGVVASIQQVFLAYVSGTLGAGFMAHGFTPGQNSIPTGGAELTPRMAALSDAQPKCRAFQGSTLTAAPTLIRPAFSMGPALATTAVFPFISLDDVDGSIGLLPGGAYAFQGAALGGGTAPLVAIGLLIEEIPLPT